MSDEEKIMFYRPNDIVCVDLENGTVIASPQERLNKQTLHLQYKPFDFGFLFYLGEYVYKQGDEETLDEAVIRELTEKIANGYITNKVGRIELQLEGVLETKKVDPFELEDFYYQESLDDNRLN